MAFKLSDYFAYCYLLEKYLIENLEDFNDYSQMMFEGLYRNFPPDMEYKKAVWKPGLELDKTNGAVIAIRQQDTTKDPLIVDGTSTRVLKIYKDKATGNLHIGIVSDKWGSEYPIVFESEALRTVVKELDPRCSAVGERAHPDKQLEYAEKHFPTEMLDELAGLIMNFKLKQAIAKQQGQTP